jgi:uncharacterized protein (DUF983 family)
MPVIRCERCGASQYAAAHAMRPECSKCGHEISVTRKALLDPVIAAGIVQRAAGALRSGRVYSPGRSAKSRP